MELIGTIKTVFEEKSFPSGFTVREFVITTTDDRYPSQIILQLNKEKTSLINEFKEGDRVRVQFDIRGREANGRYFNSLVAWRIERDGGQASPSQGSQQAYRPAPAGTPSTSPPPPPPPADYPEDDLPF